MLVIGFGTIFCVRLSIEVHGRQHGFRLLFCVYVSSVWECGVCVCLYVCVFISHRYHALPLRGLHQSSIYPDRGEEWQEKTVFVILFHLLSHWKCAEGKAGKESGGGAGGAGGRTLF